MLPLAVGPPAASARRGSCKNDAVTVAELAPTLGHRARREARTLVGRWPSVARRFKTGEFPTRATEVCIEGFLRSGNTFTVIAFQQAQPRAVSIAHHVHAAGAVLAAVDMGTPTIVLIRPPDDSALSYVVRWPQLTIGQALRGYIRFYAPLVAHRERFVVGRFGEVTSDPGSVIERLNDRFGTTFEPFVPTDENLRAVREELDRWDANTYRLGGPVELGRGRPTEEKQAVKATLRQELRGRSVSRLRERAERLHRTMTSDAG
jgi:hypothetical protein